MTSPCLGSQPRRQARGDTIRLLPGHASMLAGAGGTGACGQGAAQAGAGIALVDAMTVLGQDWPDVVAVPVRTKVNASVQIFHVQTEPLSRLALAFVDTLTTIMRR